MIENLECQEVYQTCWLARDGFSGGLDYSVVCYVMGLMQIEPEEQIDILKKIQAVESKLKEENKQ